MNLPQCEREESVRKAASRGRLSESMLTHAGQCEVCSEVLLVSRYLLAQADADLRTVERLAPLPDAGLVWWKAQVRARRESARAAARPILVVQTISWSLGLLAAAAAGAWAWPHLENWSVIFRFAWSQWTSIGAIATPVYLLAGGAALLLTFLLFGIYAAWAEE